MKMYLKYCYLLHYLSAWQKYIEVPDNYPEEMVQEMTEKGCTQEEIFKAIQQYFKEHGVQG
ncbi:MAG TPA: hypothetical protein V6C58_13800 [Allocoleopsis sp.]